MKYAAFLVMIICFSGALAKAQDPAPKPTLHPSKQIELEKSEREKKQKSLEREAEKMTADLSDTKRQLVDIAAKIKQNEAVLTDLDAQVAKGREERDAIQKRLKKEKGAIGDLVLALERLDRVPPEAVIAKPGAPLDTAQSALLLQSILPDIYSRAENLKKDIAMLGDVLATLEKNQAEAKRAADTLIAQQEEMEKLLEKRQSLYDMNRSDYKAEQDALKEISAKAQNLRDLVSRIEQREREAAEAKKREEAQKAATRDVEIPEEAPVRTARLKPTPIPKDGAAQLPVSGVIRVGYRQTDDIGAESQGLTIEGRSGALVVSPMGGVVRYAGNFKGYGRIIIVEHQKDYHSLIAGLAKIDTVVGQSVAAGEPVGALSRKSKDGGKPTLYYELRLNGEPVNPSRKIAGL